MRQNKADGRIRKPGQMIHMWGVQYPAVHCDKLMMLMIIEAVSHGQKQVNLSQQQYTQMEIQLLTFKISAVQRF